MSQSNELAKLAPYLSVNTTFAIVTGPLWVNSYFRVPEGNTSTRPTAANGIFRYNNEIAAFEGYANGVWNSMGTSATAYVRQTFTANGTATSFTIAGGYTGSQISVYVNGIKQINGTDVNVTSGSAIVFTVAPPSGAIVDTEGLNGLVPIANALPLTGGSLTGSLIIPTGSTLSVGNAAVNASLTSTGLLINGVPLVIGYKYIASNTTLTTGLYIVDTSVASAANLNLTLPSGPSLGTAIVLEDANNSWKANNVTILNNGSTIMGSSTSLILDVSNQKFTLWYNGSDWRLL